MSYLSIKMKFIPVGVQLSRWPVYTDVGEHHNWVSLSVVHAVYVTELNVNGKAHVWAKIDLKENIH
jgi:hypothetical protein